MFVGYSAAAFFASKVAVNMVALVGLVTNFVYIQMKKRTINQHKTEELI